MRIVLPTWCLIGMTLASPLMAQQLHPLGESAELQGLSAGEFLDRILFGSDPSQPQPGLYCGDEVCYLALNCNNDLETQDPGDNISIVHWDCSHPQLDWLVLVTEVMNPAPARGYTILIEGPQEEVSEYFLDYAGDQSQFLQGVFREREIAFGWEMIIVKFQKL